MKSLLIILYVVGVAIARPGYLGLSLGTRSLLHSPLAYSSVAAPLAYSTVAAPIPYAHTVSSQYHAQDELGQYSYGYAGGPSAKSEVKTFDGVTRGGYSYIDAEGKVQSVNYVADPVNGFRVAATNLPVAPGPIPVDPLVAPKPVQDTPEVAAAKVAHEAAFAEAKAAADAAPDVNIIEGPIPVAVVPAAKIVSSSVISRNFGVSPAYAPSLAYGAVSPAVIYSAIAPTVAPAPIARYAYSAVAPALSYAHHPISYTSNLLPATYSAVAPAIAPHSISSQYHAQDEFGQYSYGYASENSAKNEIKTFDGVTRGGYSYVDPEGKIQTVNYVADPINGFRVAATNLPVAPAAPVQKTMADTAEVAALKAKHLAEVEKARLQSA